MPDFSVRLTVPIALAVWNDPPLGQLPSRTNPAVGRPLLRRVCPVGQLVTIRATVDGVAGPFDVALGGRLFVGWFAEHPTPKPPVTVSANRTSVRSFTPTVVGHYTYVLHRAGGGGIILHLDVQPP